MKDPNDKAEKQRWLLLAHQLPAKPAYLRVKLWRRLQAIGAVAIKGSLSALPAGAEQLEDFEWLAQEILAGGGEAIICEARLVAGLSDAEMRALFNAARDSDYDSIAREAGRIAKESRRKSAKAGPVDIKNPVARLRARFNHVASIDFFGANGRESANGILSALETAPAEPSSGDKDNRTKEKRMSLANRTWVTRAGIHVDRIASAWLIRRFIDPKAKFRFAPARGDRPAARELRFDMPEGEFTHKGDRCTFEVLLDEVGLGDVALRAIGEIVHDIDLKDGKFARPQTEGIKTLIAGICMASDSDEERLRRGSAILEDLYAFFRKTKGR